MKKYLLLLLIAASVFAFGRFKADFVSPGATGLNSTYDVDALRPTDARVLVNVDVDSKPGALRPRFGLKSYGSVLDSTYDAAPYYNSRYGYKLLFGVRAEATMTIQKPRRLTDSVSSGTWSFTPSQIRRVAASDDLHINLKDTLFSWLYPAERYDWLKIYDQLILADGQSSPLLLGAVNITPGFPSQDYAGTNPQFQYGRRRISLGPEAPGQLRVGLTNMVGSLDGAYQYRMRYLGFDNDSLGAPGLASATVYPNSQAVMVSLFESKPFRYKGGATADSSAGDSSRTAHGWQLIQLERRRGDGTWYYRDRFSMYSKDTLVYIDTVADTLTVLADTFDIAVSVPTPGAWYECNLADTLHPADTRPTQLASDNLENDDYWVAYSYYDPISETESPLGPKTRIDGPLNIVGADSLLTLVMKGRTRIAERAQYIRFYRSLKNDSTVLYAMFDLPANAVDLSGFQQFYWSWGVPVGWGADSVVSTGLYPNSCGQYYGGSLGDTTIIVLTSDGDPLARPPYTSGCDIPFSDVEWFANRVWGIGDPEFKQKLYYSEADNIGDFPPTNNLELDADDNDELVSIVASDADVMYAFKHNKIFAVTGYDPQYDLQFQTISSRHGAANANSVVKVSPFIYFVSPDFSVYRLAGGSLDTVSTAVDSTIEGMFGTQQAIYQYARLFRFNDRLFLMNDSTGYTLTYSIASGAWSQFTTDGTYRMKNGFPFDTINWQRGFGNLDDWMLITGPSYLVKEVRNTHPFYSVDYIGGVTVSPDVVYQTPYIGDGENVWEITEVELTGQDRYNLDVVATIYNQFGDSLMSVTANFGTVGNYRMGFGPHIGRYLAVRFTIPNQNGLFEIHKVTVFYRKVGDEKIR